ncbi:ATP-binding protein [Hoeflea sp.]|uniref:PAS domain-containing sensor histidine kinase n=1 Tax=Hoeflea sp. TaxID=1940281 RepID=UPI003B518717
MQPHHYPFIDLCVHPDVRELFAQGDAVAVFSDDLEAVLWANGAAAELFGYATIYDILDEGLTTQPVIRRQIAGALSALERTGKPQHFMMRISRGFSRIMTPANLRTISLPDGASGIMMSSQARSALAPKARARQIISGFEGTGTHVAVLDDSGAVLAASQTFDTINIDQGSIRRMITDVADENDRLIKRMVEAGESHMPAAIARLTDSPALHLLFAVEPASDEDNPVLHHQAPEEAVPGEAGGNASVPETSIGAGEDDEAQQERDVASGEASEDETTYGDHDASDPEADADESRDGGKDETASDDAGEESADGALPGEETSEPATGARRFDAERVRDELTRTAAPEPDPDAVPGPFADARGIETPPDAEAEPETASADDALAENPAPEQPAPAASAFRFNPDAKPARFVWKINRDGAFSEVSPEFAEAVGPNAADIVGRRFSDLARVFNLDPDHVIEDALNRRDTWSGKTVFWPIQGTDQVTPVDLAALPTYTRDRVFDGFRGFGIVRSGETRTDPEAIGLALEPGMSAGDDQGAAQLFQEDESPAADAIGTGYDLEALERNSESSDFGEDLDDLARLDGVDPADAGLADESETETVDEADASGTGDPGGEDLDPASEDPFRGEQPALRLVETPMRRESDKVISLETRRSRSARDALSAGEQAAFREIGARLTESSGAGSEDNENPAPEAQPPFGKRQPPLGSEDETRDIEVDFKDRDIEAEISEPTSEEHVPDETGLAFTPETSSSDSDHAEETEFETGEGDEALDDSPVEETGSQEILPEDEHENGYEARDDASDSVGPADEPETADLSSAEEAADRPDDSPTMETSGLDERSGYEDQGDEASDTDPVDTTETVGDEATGETGPEPESPEAPAAETDDTKPEDSAAQADLAAVAPMPSAFAIPARQQMRSGLDASLIDAIPSPLLVHAGDDLIHANPEFLELTGYASLEALAEAGGLDALLDRSGEAVESGDTSLVVRRGDGETRRVKARLRSVNWLDSHALLLALTPVHSDASGYGSAIADGRGSDAEGESGKVIDLPVAGLHASTPAANDQSETGEQADDAAAAGSQASDALQIEAQELRSILETATDGVVVLDNDGTIRSMNSSACALFNYDESDTLHQPFAMLFAHESQRAVMDYVSGLAEHGVSSVLNDGREVIGREASGGFLPLFMTIGRLSGSNGFCAVLRDITQWKRTEEELRTAKRAAETANSHKSDFLARVSHEIRTPLNAIIGFSEMMVEERFGPIGSPRYLEYAHDIGNSGKHVLDIVNDLLDISKIEAGQVDMEFTAVSLNGHLAESVSLLQPMANSQRVIIRTSLSESVPDVVADQRSVKQIALNLLSNAIRYTPAGGQIVVSTSYEPSGNVVIRIRDTGIGMNRKELEQAMKPFGQVGPGPRQRGDGTGLGLPLTKAMVEANRARFDIVSTPGEGTLVSISFPPQRVLAD